MATPTPRPAPVETLEQARARIADLEKALDDAITVILKRDDQLRFCERRIQELEERLGA